MPIGTMTKKKDDTPADLAPIPLGSAPALAAQPQPFQGARDFLNVSHAVQDWAQGRGATPKTPQLAWNPRFGTNGASWESAPDGVRVGREMPGNFLRPPTGPESAAGAARAAKLDAIASQHQLRVPDITPTAVNPVRPGMAQTQPPKIPERVVTPDNGATGAPKPVAWNPRFGADGASWQNAPDGQRIAHALPENFLKPAPGTLAATASDTGSAAPTGGVTIGGRHLPYGAMVNGVPTFSDGSGGMNGTAGSIPRTMAQDAIDNLGKAPSIGRADAGVLSMPLASDALGATPSSDQMVAQRMAQIQQPITGSRPSAAQFAEADRLAAASRDPRSAAGIAARNLAVESEFARTPRSRAAAAAQLAQLTNGTDQANLQGIQDDAAMARTQVSGANTLQNTALQGENTLRNTALTGQNAMEGQIADLLKPREGKPVQLEDGTLGLQDPVTARVTAGQLADGTPAKGQLKNPPAPVYTQAGGAKVLTDMADAILQINPMNGTIPDPNAKGGQRLPTGEERFAALQQANAQLQRIGAQQGLSTKEEQAKALGARIGTDPATGRRVAQINGKVVPL